MMISQKGYQALQAHSESHIRHGGLGRDGLPAVWVYLIVLLLKGLQRPMAEEMGADFPPQTIPATGMRNAAVVALSSWVSVARRSGRERGRRSRSGCQMSQMRSSSSASPSFVGEILVKKLGTLVNNGTPRSVALKGGKVDGRDGV